MTQRTPSDVLSHYSNALQKAAPAEWDAFVQTFDAYATEVTVAVTEAEPGDILCQQGRAKAFIHLLGLFRSCGAKAAKAAAAAQSTPQQPTQQP